MTYRIPLPAGGRLSSLDVVDPSTSGVQRHLRRTGLSSYEPSTAAALLACFERSGEGFVFHDIGANIGLYALMAAALFEPSSVVAFEPTPETADIAEAIARANGLDIEVVRSALSDHHGHAALYISPLADSSNSLDAEFRVGAETVSVPVNRLDDIVGRSGIGPDVVKIDVETHEGAVLRGARGTIETHRPSIVIEVLRGRRGRDFAAEVGDAIAGLGYSMYELLATPSFEPETDLFSSVGGTRDWLFMPQPITEEFASRWTVWSERLASCTPDRNSRAPISPAVKRAFDRGGGIEVLATARREARRRLGRPRN